jgi:UDP-glucuronate decarboxylase
MQRQPDISLAAQELSWQPTIPLDAGLKKTVSYFEKLSA